VLGLLVLQVNEFECPHLQEIDDLMLQVKQAQVVQVKKEELSGKQQVVLFEVHLCLEAHLFSNEKLPTLRLSK